MPLFLPRLLKKRLQATPPPPHHLEIIQTWATKIADGSLAKQGEIPLHGDFLQRFFVEILGYRPFSVGKNWTLHQEKNAGPGQVDAALGHFSAESAGRIVAPFELKGADTRNLDAIMPGRHKTPVQQVWEYANATPGCRFLLLSNYVELRLYSASHGNQAYEYWELARLHEPVEYARFQLLLGAERLLGEDTANLLKESDAADKEITDALYSDYRRLRENLIATLEHCNPKLARDESIRFAQTLLDRVLFIAFAEDRGLLESGVLARAYEHCDPYNPRPVWDNFKGLFRAIDRGNPQLRIPAYNGGLFAKNAAIDRLTVPDDLCEAFKALSGYDFESEVGVTVLGHIFEQSISDLERLREAEELETDVAEKKTSRAVTGKRKRDGVVYTPDTVTTFITEETLGRYLKDRFQMLLSGYGQENADGEIQWRKPTEEEDARFKTRAKKDKAGRSGKMLVEYLFWHQWRDTLRGIRVCDPACGSGAFLVAAFDVLATEYQQVNQRIEALTGGTVELFDLDKEILNSNLYGVDLNPESVEITKLSLWLKTAKRGKPLASLDTNIQAGNSLIDDDKYTPTPYDWNTAFPNVFADGGFDVILGNPPYVRMERLKAIKPYLKTRYSVADERADLFCYFYELGVRLLKTGGRLGYISSSTFFKSGSGEPLRRHLLQETVLRALVDFGDLQVFEGVTTYAAIVIVERGQAEEDGAALALCLDAWPEEGLSAAFARKAKPLPQSQLSAESWRIESGGAAALRAKLAKGRKTLMEVYGSPLYGIKTGLNEAFVVDGATRKALIAQDAASEELLKPFLEGKDLKKWRAEPHGLWLIYIPKGAVDIDGYPAIRDHLLPYKNALEKRATKQEWFELQQAQAAYALLMEGIKIGYVDLSSQPNFSLESTGAYFANTAYFVPKADMFLLGYLNSCVAWYWLTGQAPAYRGGFFRLFSQYVETLPIPEADDDARAKLADLAKACQKAAETRRDAQAKFRRRIPGLSPSGRGKLSQRLERWWLLSDFAAFHAEVKKTFKQAIPLKEQSEWEEYFSEAQEIVSRQDGEIACLERAIEQAAYKLFELTPDEIALVEGTAEKVAEEMPNLQPAEPLPPEPATKPAKRTKKAKA